MKSAKEIIAENLPTWLEWYQYPPRNLPRAYDIETKAVDIIRALELEGYRIEKANGK